MSDLDLLELAMRDSLDHCVKCTICETFCPVAAVTPLFPGPKYVGPQAERFRVADEPSADASLDYCSGCGVCTQVCPQGVHIAEINTQARAKLKERTGIKPRDRILAMPDVGGRLGTPAARLANHSLAAPGAAGRRRAPARARPPGRAAVVRGPDVPALGAQACVAAGAAAGRLLPRLRRELVRAGHGREDRRAAGVDGLPGARCRAARRAAGCRRSRTGCSTSSRRYVRRMARKLAPPARAGIDIVGTSTSCTLMLKREAREILGMDCDDDLRAVSERMFDICEYLLALHDRGELRTDFKPLPLTVTYHAPCQQQGHGIGKPALDLLALVPELRVIENDATCCGVAGHVRAQAREVRHRDESRRRPVRPDRRCRP